MTADQPEVTPVATAATWDDDEIVSGFSPETGRTVYGPCPACDDWQLDVPYLEDHAVVEAILREHDVEAHPGLLDRHAR